LGVISGGVLLVVELALLIRSLLGSAAFGAIESAADCALATRSCCWKAQSFNIFRTVVAMPLGISNRITLSLSIC
jgi:hypothetical protein